MFGRCACMAVAVMLVGLSTGQAADTTLTLACQGTQIMRGKGTASEQINIGVIVDFQKKAVLGLGGESESVPITSISETIISFDAKETGWVMSGTLDRVTGALVLSSIKFDPNTRKEQLTTSLDLQCKPTQRMF